MITEEQRAARSLGIGGSDMPIILGLSSYKTPYVLYLEKKGLIDNDYEESEQAYWGSRLESTIRDHFVETNKIAVEEPGTIVHPLYDYLRGNLDGFIPEWNAVLEIKCSDKFMRHEWGENASDAIPMQYLCQVAHYCAVTNANKAIIAVLIGGNEYREFTYMRDFELEGIIIDAASAFWKAVQSDEPPTAINIDDLKIKYGKANTSTPATLNATIAKELTKVAEVRAKIKELNKLEEHSKFQIMEYMKESDILVDESGKTLVTWRSSKAGRRIFLMKGI